MHIYEYSSYIYSYYCNRQLSLDYSNLNTLIIKKQKYPLSFSNFTNYPPNFSLSKINFPQISHCESSWVDAI